MSIESLRIETTVQLALFQAGARGLSGIIRPREAGLLVLGRGSPRLR